MNTPTPLRPFLLPALALSLVAGLAACSGGGRRTSSFPVNVFREAEPNDDALTANDFGVLFPGDNFFIDGTITDSGLDPFDGFSFVAGEPIHVDFLLHHTDPRTDFDVCLFDPQTAQTVACFATPDLPETGGVDVTGTGLAFQLVVESFLGTGGYSLEIQVVGLGFALKEQQGTTGALLATGATEVLGTGRNSDLAGYGPTGTTRSVTARTVDPLTGAVTEQVTSEEQ